MSNFTQYNLPAPLMKALEQMKFTTPTPIQEAAIPVALQGRDILGSAQTGTGKTGAFGIPLVAALLSNSRGSALIMTPTRELAVQVHDMLCSLLGKYSPIKTAQLIGGESMPKQLQELRMRPRLIVGTPGRIFDHLERGSLMLHDVKFLVLDETDRMLDMGFSIQIERIMKFVPQQRQTMLFSATMPSNIKQLAERYLNNPETISVGGQSKPAENLVQEMIEVQEEHKYTELLRQLDKRSGSVIVFVKTKWGADKMAMRLRKAKYDADAIHGDLRQNKRDKVIAAFRESKFRILVATDIAARGLDIPHIEHVINYDLPQAPEDFIHRIGRTARNGAEGSTICLLAPADKVKWRAIQKLLNPEMFEKSGKPEGNGEARSNAGGAPNKKRRRPPQRRRSSAGAGGRGNAPMSAMPNAA